MVWARIKSNVHGIHIKRLKEICNGQTQKDQSNNHTSEWGLNVFSDLMNEVHDESTLNIRRVKWIHDQQPMQLRRIKQSHLLLTSGSQQYEQHTLVTTESLMP